MRDNKPNPDSMNSYTPQRERSTEYQTKGDLDGKMMGTLMDKNSKALLTVRDVAEMLGLSIGGVYHLVSQ